MESKKEPTANNNWYTKLLSNLSDLFDDLKLESEERSTLREFVIKIAKDQYNAGNKSGIRWILQQQQKNNNTAEAST